MPGGSPRTRGENTVNALAYDLFTTLGIGFGLMVAGALWKAQKKAIRRDLTRILQVIQRRA